MKGKKIRQINNFIIRYTELHQYSVWTPNDKCWKANLTLEQAIELCENNKQLLKEYIVAKQVELIEKIVEHPLGKKNIYKRTWISDSLGEVHPITSYPDRIVLSWDSTEECPDFIQWLISFEFVHDVTLQKSDGTCPSIMTIYCKERDSLRLYEKSAEYRKPIYIRKNS